jgi:hypothetical protein
MWKARRELTVGQLACAPWWEPVGWGSNLDTHKTPAQGRGWGINPSSKKCGRLVDGGCRGSDVGADDDIPVGNELCLLMLVLLIKEGTIIKDDAGARA